MLSLQMSAPHSPTENSILNDYSSLPVIPDGHPRKTPQVPNTHYTNQSQTESPLMSSLIALELDEQEIVIDKKMFGQLWRDYQLEKKLRFGCPVNECGLLSQKLKQHWKIEVVEVVDHEFIGYEPTHHSLPSVLIHVIMLPNNQFELTVRAKQSTRDIKEFLSRRRLT
ncbi:hypothetical protein BDB01DRAFT_809023 [Pilobolus umbonatus]|nr:hypothetical protein BDB01DRAFT_809023 [Pilobolus umbonatus]